MTIASIPISPFEGFGIKNEAKEASREAIHEAIGGWIDEVIEMKKGAGLGGITEEIFKKRQEMMGKIGEQIIVELFSDELNPLDDALILSNTVKQWDYTPVCNSKFLSKWVT